jgi:hypothetical protein
MTPQQHAQVLAQQQAQAQEDAEEPSGDELDFLTAKDVAVARYKRNHDYIAEVFSPYPTCKWSSSLFIKELLWSLPTGDWRSSTVQLRFC